MTGLVREFLEYFDLDFSIAVFDPETNFVSDGQIYICQLSVKDVCVKMFCWIDYMYVQTCCADR